jgi:hypothetical protein
MAADGSWQSLPEWDGELLMTLFRERLLVGWSTATPSRQ